MDGPADRSAEASRVWLTETFDGRWSLTGDLSADDGAMLAGFLEAQTADSSAARLSRPIPMSRW